MQSSVKFQQVERKFLKTETPFQTTVAAQPSSASRFPKILAMYLPTVYQNENNTTVFEWNVSDATELRKVAKMYYVRYNLAAK